MSMSEFLPLLCCLIPFMLSFWLGYWLAMRACRSQLEG